MVNFEIVRKKYAPTQLDSLVALHQLDVALSSPFPGESPDRRDFRQGRKRKATTISPEEIRERSGTWRPLVVGKTTREVIETTGACHLSEHQAELWLWAVVGPALDLAPRPDGVWEDLPDDQETRALLLARRPEGADWWLEHMKPAPYEPPLPRTT